MGKRQRKLLLGCASLLGGLLLLWFSVPLWFPWVLRPLARHQGLHYARYERSGYSHFTLRGASFTNQDVRIRAERVDALVPNIWLWRSLFERKKATQPFLRVERWELEPVSGAAARGSGSTNQAAASPASYPRALQTLRRWLPVAVLLDGTLRVQHRGLALQSVMWSKGDLQAKLGAPDQPGLATLNANLDTPQPYEVLLSSEPLNFRSTIALTLDQAGIGLRGQGEWWSNRVEFAAQFGPKGGLPETARLNAPHFEFPAELAQLPGYSNITGSLSASWKNGQFALDLNAGTRPPEVQAYLPPLTLDLHARGDTNVVMLDSARISAPWLRAELSRKLRLHFEGPLLREPATLQVAADLSEQPWLPLQGVLRGEAYFQPVGRKLPVAHFQVSGSDIGDASLKARTVNVTGNLHFPWLQVRELIATFADGSKASLRGRLELNRKLVEDSQVQFAGPLARRWLPAGYAYENLSLAGNLHGPLSNLTHSGRLEVTNFTSPDFQPLNLRASWSGQQENLPQIEALAVSGRSSLRVQGSLALDRAQAALQLTKLSLLTNSEPVLELVRPGRLTLGLNGSSHPGRLVLTPLEWAGGGRELQAEATLNWPRTGTLRLQARNLATSLFAAFPKKPLPDIAVKRLEASGGWTNGPAVFNLQLAAAGTLPQLAAARGTQLNSRKPVEGTPSASNTGASNTVVQSTSALPLALELTASGNQSGMALTNLLLTSQTAAVAVAHGFLPLTLHPGAATHLVRLETTRPLQLSAVTQPQAFFWNRLGDWLGFSLREPTLKLELTGTWQAPRGVLALHVARLEPGSTRTNMPLLEELHFTLLFDRQQARLTEGQLFVQRQPVRFGAELPLDASFWQGLLAGELPDWKKARAHLRIDEAELAAFEPLFPHVLAPEGALDLKLSLLPGRQFEGAMAVTRARTRPLGDAGPIRDINIRMSLSGNTLSLESARANLGGANLFAAGQADLSGEAWLKGALPPCRFSLSGTNVPLSRQPESIIRSDLNLTIAKTNGAPPLVTGVAHLRDSYFLSDLGALVPGKVATPARRPPYFSIDDPSLADWRLALHVEGERFLKLRTPLFNGEVSANLNLQGTLKDPIALGDVKINSGVVRFPFASLQVQEGFVTLSSQDPYRPQLSVRANSKQYGFDIRMELTGPVDAPVLQFSSTPPLASEQILLMVTAGELPRGLYTLTPQQKAQTVAMFLGRDLLSRLGFGDQAEQRLTIRSGEEISQTGRPTYNVEYKFAPRWSVEGEYDRFGDFNAGFKWRIYSK